MPVRRAVIPAAGLGTRMLPASKVIPKYLIPVVDKPMIQYAVEEAVRAGIRDICIVISPGQESLIEHFEPSLELEAALKEKGKTDLLDQVQAIASLGQVETRVQEEALGLGNAVFLASDFVDGESFAVLLPDEIYDPKENFLAEMISSFEATSESLIGVIEVDPEEINLYGSIAREATDRPDMFRVHDVIEKPEPSEAPSNFAVVGRYVLNPEILGILEELPPGAGGEIQLSDGLQALAKRGRVLGQLVKSRRWDAGRKDTYLEAVVTLAAESDELGPDFRRFLESFRP